jgi:PAS domain S-box-containing protein
MKSEQCTSLCHRILNSVTDGVFTVDTDLTITFFNRSAEKITGTTENRAVGEKCYNIFKSSLCKSNCPIKLSIETGRDTFNQNAVIVNQKGNKVPIRVGTSVLLDYDGDIAGAVETFHDISTIETLRKELSKQYTFEDIISKNYKIQQILTTLPDISESGSTVLIEGPSGSGKELFAKAIHRLSNREGEFIALNCAALPDTLLESELFGYKEGAFTGAKKDKKGRFALAEKGTIFLDEMGDISPALQLRLLRVLQEMEYEPLGGTCAVKADVRVIAATNKCLKDLVAQGQFRDDLFFRLNVIKIPLPPLSEHREDIPLLVDHFLLKFNKLKQKEIESVSTEVLNLLMQYDYPGNIRELENIIEYTFVLCHGWQIETHHLPIDFIESNKEKNILDRESTPLATAEEQAIVDALNNFDGKRSSTANFLGIEKSTLWRKMKKLGITFPKKR